MLALSIESFMGIFGGINTRGEVSEKSLFIIDNMISCDDD